MTKRKDEIRELLKEDEFLSYMERGIKYAQANRSRVIMAAVAFFVAIGAAIGMYEWQKVRSDKSAQALYEVEDMLLRSIDDPLAKVKFESEKEKNEAVLAKLDEVISSDSGVVADQARLHKVAVLVNLGRQAEAVKMYEDMSRSGGLMGLFAKMGLADYYLGEGDSEKALTLYNGVINSPEGRSHFEDLAKYRIAECYRKQGDDATAREQLEAIVAKYENADPADQAPIFQKAKSMLDEIVSLAGDEAS
ncbi:MAG: tetratricopeptide repeat protein [Acidobacteria bacterium]|nr:tetratricopeptide repeat protein [Acidobacteriota bacterium]